MSNLLKDTIEKMEKDSDCPDNMKGFLELLKKKQAELGDDITDEQANAAVKDCLEKHLLGTLSLTIDDDMAPEAASDYMKDAKATVKEYFAQRNWHYSEHMIKPDLAIFELGLTEEHCNLRMQVYIETNPKVCRINAILPITADPTYAYLLCEKMAKENYPRRYGALQYEESTGEVSYRYSFPIGHGLHIDDLRMIFLAVSSSASDSFEEIRKYCVGKFKLTEKSEILTKLNALVGDLNDD